MRLGYAKRTDANQKRLVELMRKIGMKVLILSNVGEGVPDLLVGFNNQLKLCEIKDGKKFLSAQRLTPDQEKFFAEWDGYCTILRCEEDVLLLHGKMLRCKE
jgi:hypothetical protein